MCVIISTDGASAGSNSIDCSRFRICGRRLGELNLTMQGADTDFDPSSGHAGSGRRGSGDKPGEKSRHVLRIESEGVALILSGSAHSRDRPVVGTMRHGQDTRYSGGMTWQGSLKGRRSQSPLRLGMTNRSGKPSRRWVSFRCLEPSGASSDKNARASRSPAGISPGRGAVKAPSPNGAYTGTVSAKHQRLRQGRFPRLVM